MRYFVEHWEVSEAQAKRLDKTGAAKAKRVGRGLATLAPDVIREVNCLDNWLYMELTDKFNKAHIVYYIRQGRKGVK